MKKYRVAFRETNLYEAEVEGNNQDDASEAFSKLLMANKIEPQIVDESHLSIEEIWAS